MSESSEERLPEEAAVVNPYGSPGVSGTESLAAARDPSAIRPNFSAVAIGLTVGLVDSLLMISLYDVGYEPLLIELIAYSVTTLTEGCLIGLGIALLLHAVKHKIFFALMPGHWSLTAFVPMLLSAIQQLLLLGVAYVIPFSMRIRWIESADWQTEVIFIVIPATTLALFILIVMNTRETLVWQVFAWCNTCYWALETVNEFAEAVLIERNDSLDQFFLLPLAFSVRLSALAIALVMLAGVVSDLRSKRQRDLLHWIGLIQIIALPMIHFAVRYFPQALDL